MVAVLNSDPILDLLGRTIFHNEPTMRQFLDLVGRDTVDLREPSACGIPSWVVWCKLAPASSPRCSASHLVMIPTVRLPAGSAARAMENLSRHKMMNQKLGNAVTYTS